MTADRPVLGILMIIGFCALAPLGDSIAKLLGETIPLYQLLVVRFGIQAVLLVPLVWLSARSFRMTRRLFGLAALRTFLHILGMGAMFTGLRFLPLADTVAIAFVMPFIMLLLGKYVLSEEVGARRLTACCVGFIGTLFVIQPSFASVGYLALLPLMVAVTFALFMLVTRQIAKEIDPVSLQGLNGMMACVLLGALHPFFADAIPAMSFVTPTGSEYALLALIGIIGTAAHLLMTLSLRFAPSATVAPVQYLEIPFATALGYLIFNDWPNNVAMIGIAITMAAGLYILLREQQNAKLVPPVA